MAKISGYSAKPGRKDQLFQEQETFVTDIPTGQMTWRIPGSSESALHLRHDASEPWRPYKDFPQYVLPDPPGFSEGYATFLALLKQKWQSL